ncbi:MAG: hypothetical protein Q9195_006916 [Heterodermia aff. obscurata]
MPSSLRRNPPFRAEHLGSLLRPAYLLQAREDVERNPEKQQELKSVEDEAIKAIVRAQLDMGFNSITDVFWGTFFQGLQGFEVIERPGIDMFRPYMPDIAAYMEEGHGPVDSVICTGKIKHVGSTYTEQWNYLKSLLSEDKVRGAKLTLPAPEWYHMRYREGKAYPTSVYASDEEYFADIAAAYHTELQTLYDHGLRNVQIDDPNFACEYGETGLASTLLTTCQTFARKRCSRVGKKMDQIGNFAKSRHFSEGGYDRIAKKLFRDLDVDTYYLEYDTPRAGGFAPLKHLPSNRNVILGIITSKFPKMENPDQLTSRVFEAADIIAKGGGDTQEEALNRIGVSPQCGFASHSGGNALEMKDMLNKLRLVRRLADAIWTDDRGQPMSQ